MAFVFTLYMSIMRFLVQVFYERPEQSLLRLHIDRTENVQSSWQLCYLVIEMVNPNVALILSLSGDGTVTVGFSCSFGHLYTKCSTSQYCFYWSSFHFLTNLSQS